MANRAEKKAQKRRLWQTQREREAKDKARAAEKAKEEDAFVDIVSTARTFQSQTELMEQLRKQHEEDNLLRPISAILPPTIPAAAPGNTHTYATGTHNVATGLNVTAGPNVITPSSIQAGTISAGTFQGGGITGGTITASSSSNPVFRHNPGGHGRVGRPKKDFRGVMTEIGYAGSDIRGYNAWAGNTFRCSTCFDTLQRVKVDWVHRILDQQEPATSAAGHAICIDELTKMAWICPSLPEIDYEDTW